MFRHARMTPMIAALWLVSVSAGEAFAQSSKTVQHAVSSLQPGGKTLVGPGLFKAPGGTPSYVAQLTQDTNVCATITHVAGDSINLNLENSIGTNLQGVIVTAVTPSAGGCADVVRNVEIECVGANPCIAAWRVDAR